MSADAVPAHPAATVTLLRDGEGGVEVLLVRRSSKLAFHGGAWVFPGGRIDPGDEHVDDGGDVIAAARRAARREAREEAGLGLENNDLVVFSRWVTPVGLPKRFDTWFFATRADADDVQVDGSEIHEHRWLQPLQALAARDEGSIELPPPTFVTLNRLALFATADEALRTLAAATVETFIPRVHVVGGGACCLYEGDVAYDSGDLQRSGPQHRLWMLGSGWRYERE